MFALGLVAAYFVMMLIGIASDDATKANKVLRGESPPDVLSNKVLSRAQKFVYPIAVLLALLAGLLFLAASFSVELN